MILDRTQVRASFARAASSYERAAVLQRRVADQLLDRFQWVTIDPRRILDVGTGTGYGLPPLRRRFRKAQVIGIDIAPAMLKVARARSGLWRRSPLVAADGEHLPVAGASIDVLYSNLALQWMDPVAAFQEFQRVLRPGGLLTFSTFGPDTLMELRAAWAAADDRPHVHSFVDMHDLGDALVHTGFADPVLDVDRFTLTYEKATDALRDLKRIGAHNVRTGRFSGLTGKTAFQRFVDAYETMRSDGRLPLTYEVVYGQAWRGTVSADGSAHVPLSAIGGRRRR
ncbi:MAG: malonyl-ACP O-methyltransferase BioC [Gammaproteobacteria bacterium]|nr:malonyl-ACP O-methyltransferase BioC [Gammaproteobacteria bacterium]